MDHPLTCNNLKCRADLVDRALVTTCSHIFCLDCTTRFCLSDQNGQNQVPCPACDTQLASPDDAVISNLKPSEAYKTSVLSGLSPSIIMECAGRALSFWAYQTTQNIYYQQYLYKTLTEKFSALNSRLEQTVNEANSQIETLQRKINSLATENDNSRKKNEELSKAYKEKNRQLLQTQELHDKLRHTVEMGHIQRAATDAIDSRFQQPSRHFSNQQTQPQHNMNSQQGNLSGMHSYAAPVEHERVSDGGIRGGMIDNGTGAGSWRRDSSATGSMNMDIVTILKQWRAANFHLQVTTLLAFRDLVLEGYWTTNEGWEWEMHRTVQKEEGNQTLNPEEAILEDSALGSKSASRLPMPGYSQLLEV